MMKKLESPRLWIIPLSLQQVKWYLENDGRLENSLGCAPYARNIPDTLFNAIKITIIPGVEKNAGQELFCTLWTIILKLENVMAGDLCFKGPPNDLGEIEIGYGLHPNFEKRGYMTEALGCLKQWALEQPGIHCIVAETESENQASHRTLIKNQFIPFQQKGEMIWWKTSR